MAAGLHAALGHGRFRLLQFSQDALAIFQEGGAFIRQGQLARRALQQFDAQALLQRIEAPAYHGRGDAFRARGRRQAAPGDHFHEGRYLSELAHMLCSLSRHL